MPIPACCVKAKFYAKSALVYSKGGFYANDIGMHTIVFLYEGWVYSFLKLHSFPDPPSKN